MINFNVSPKEPQYNEEIELLSQNIDLILANADKIGKNEVYSHVHIKGSGIDGAYIGHTNLSLGNLIKLWQNNSWKDGEKYYYHLGGSPLSGASFCTYFSKQKICCDKNKPSFGELFKSAAAVLYNQNTSDLKTIPFPLPQNIASEISLGQLIDELTGKAPLPS